MCAHTLSCVQLFVTPWTGARQASLSMEFSRQEYCSGLPFPTLGDLPDPGIEPATLVSLALAGRFFTTSATWEAHFSLLVLSIDILQIFILLYITATHTYITITLSKYFYINLFLVNIQCLHDHNPAQFSSVQSLNLILCNPMECSMPGFPVHHQLPEIT